MTFSSGIILLYLQTLFFQMGPLYPQKEMSLEKTSMVFANTI